MCKRPAAAPAPSRPCSEAPNSRIIVTKAVPVGHVCNRRSGHRPTTDRQHFARGLRAKAPISSTNCGVNVCNIDPFSESFPFRARIKFRKEAADHNLGEPPVTCRHAILQTPGITQNQIDCGNPQLRVSEPTDLQSVQQVVTHAVRRFHAVDIGTRSELTKFLSRSVCIENDESTQRVADRPHHCDPHDPRNYRRDGARRQPRPRNDKVNSRNADNRQQHGDHTGPFRVLVAREVPADHAAGSGQHAFADGLTETWCFSLLQQS